LAAIAFMFSLLPAAAQSEVLVSNVGQTLAGTLGFNSFYMAQQFTTGTNSSNGFTLSSVELRLITIDFEDGRAWPVVKIYSGSVRGTLVATLVAPSGTVPRDAIGNYTYSVATGTTINLADSTTYWVVGEASSASNRVSWVATAADGEDSTGRSGWSINNSGEWTQSSTATSFSTYNTGAFQIRVNGDLADSSSTNTAATGAPTISGTATVGQILTANAGNMADADGLPTTTFPSGYTFQWVRTDSGTDTDISGATSRTYTLQSADQGKTVKVKVSFTDQGGNSETLTSATFPSSGTVEAAPTNNTATGKPTVTVPNVFRVPAVLTADVSAIADTDGVTSIATNATYNWQRFASDGTTLEQDAIGTDSTYTLTTADVGKKIKVQVSFTDDASNSEGPLTSDAYPTSATVTAEAACPTPVLTGGATFLGGARTLTVGTIVNQGQTYYGASPPIIGAFSNNAFTTSAGTSRQITEISSIDGTSVAINVDMGGLPANELGKVFVHVCNRKFRKRFGRPTFQQSL
ncbi:MAG: hypothetical protein OXC29_09490, partial [Rhodococcus sp.]|nr:hypothetical protein [Rhodococcus sp. (in: high G+C Gram-positive bacteria)]